MIVHSLLVTDLRPPLTCEAPAVWVLKRLTDIPTAPGSTFETYAIAEKLAAANHEVHGAASFLATLDPKLPAVDAVIQARCRQLFRSHAPHYPSAEKFEEALRHGAVWRGPAAQPGGLVCRLREWPAEAGEHTAVDWTAAWTPPVLPPLATKLYRDSRLREIPSGREI